MADASFSRAMFMPTMGASGARGSNDGPLAAGPNTMMGTSAQHGSQEQGVRGSQSGPWFDFDRNTGGTPPQTPRSGSPRNTRTRSQNNSDNEDNEPRRQRSRSERTSRYEFQD